MRRIPVNAAADQLLANFTVTRPDAKESSILQMTLTSTNPDKAADTLNKLIAVYNDHSTEGTPHEGGEDEGFHPAAARPRSART